MSEPFSGLHSDEDANTFALTEAQKREIDRRLAAHDANPGGAIPWEQVEAETVLRWSRIKSHPKGC